MNLNLIFRRLAFFSNWVSSRRRHRPPLHYRLRHERIFGDGGDRGCGVGSLGLIGWWCTAGCMSRHAHCKQTGQNKHVGKYLRA